MSLQPHLARLEDILRARKDARVESLSIRLTEIDATFKANLCFVDDSRLSIVEQVERIGRWGVRRTFHKYHYHRADGTLVFRYDSSPHYPELPTFPSHKHTPDGVVEALPPDLLDVLCEIDAFLYPTKS